MSSAIDTRPAGELRAALLDAAAHLIGTDGSARLTARRVAEEVGTSTMAIYTQFGGMPGLRQAVRREGFARLTARLTAVQPSADPVADLIQVCLAYYENAVADPDLYRVVFLDEAFGEADAVTGSDAFEGLVRAVRRCIESGAFEAGDPVDLATEVWALGHGGVTLQLAGLLAPDRAAQCLLSGLDHLLTAYRKLSESPSA